MKLIKSSKLFLHSCLMIAGLLGYLTNIYAETLIKLPKPTFHTITVEQALRQRRSTRVYQPQPGPVTLAQIAQLLWAAQGVTSKLGYRTAPSAGALYPLEIYLVAGQITGLAPGVYHYLPQAQALQLTLKGDQRTALTKAALNQPPVANAPAGIVITGVYSRTLAKYKQHGRKYVHMEAGHAAQNIALQAVPLKLGVVTIGGFHDYLVQRALQLPRNASPLYIVPVGKLKLG